MLDVRDDMDELFRRAAEGYPLKTGTPDFNRVLDNLEAAKRMDTANEKKDRKRFLWLFMLIPLTIVATTFIDSDKRQSEAPGSQLEATKRVTSEPSTDVVDILPNPIRDQNKTVAEEQNGPSTRKEESEEPSVNTSNEIVLTEQPTTAKQTNNKTIATRKIARLNVKPGATIFKNERPAASTFNTDKADKHQSLVTDKTIAAGNSSSNEANVGLNKDEPAVAANKAPEAAADKQVEGQPSVQDVSASPADSIDAEVTRAAPQSARRLPTKRLYVGIGGAPDISNVKSSSFSKVGFSAGVLAGFHINKSVSIESGVLWAKRFYKSDGKYFDLKKTPIPNYVKILDLEGYCQMFEIPLNITYTITSSKRGSLYAVAGVSSYIMKREDYNYNVYNNGQTYYRYVDYRNSTNNWMATFNLGVGLQKPLGKTTALRVEPYIKLPLQGAGIGSLPITSYGLYFGLTKHIF